MYTDRIELYRKLEDKRNSKILVYVTGDKQGFETQIGADVIDFFIDHLDTFGVVNKISLFLYTRGGNTASAWNIINLLKMYCDELEVIVPHKAHSAGTLISIGAHSIMMTKQATLGPIDPSFNSALNPPIPNAMPPAYYPVGVEAVKGYLEFATKELKIKDSIALSNIMMCLSEKVHPLVLGDVYRGRGQIKMLAEKLLANQVEDKDKIQQIIDFLCSDSGSHDYTINRREAKEILGLNIIKPSDEEYQIIKKIYDDIAEELQFRKIFDRAAIAQTESGEFLVRRVLLESIYGGCNFYVNKGKIIEQRVVQQVHSGLPPAELIDFRFEDIFEGWDYEEPSREQL